MNKKSVILLSSVKTKHLFDITQYFIIKYSYLIKNVIFIFIIYNLTISK